MVMTVTKADGKKVMMKCDQSETSVGSVKLEGNSKVRNQMNQAMKMFAAEFTLTTLMKQLIKHHCELQPMFGTPVLEQCPTQTHVEIKKHCYYSLRPSSEGNSYHYHYYYLYYNYCYSWCT